MKKLILYSTLLLLMSAFCGCETQKSLYYFGRDRVQNNDSASAYEIATYNYYKNATSESLCELICVLEDIMTSSTGTSGKIPPGLCAEYGFLLLQPNAETDFGGYATASQLKRAPAVGTFQEKGIKLLKMEVELYPESSAYVAPLLKTFGE